LRDPERERMTGTSNGTPVPAIAIGINGALKALLGASGRRPARASRRLDTLFRELDDPLSADLPFEIEDLIWAIWHEHDDPEAVAGMERAIGLIAQRNDDAAFAVLDGLIDGWPDWAEPWNKRATLRFMRGEDRQSLADIAETLLREPRHFGAMAGLGQICMRHHDPRSAAVAFDAALTVNPHMSQVAAIRRRIQTEMPGVN
jgi:hypothetical protein